jgi:phosphatidylserine synthase
MLPRTSVAVSWPQIIGIASGTFAAPLIVAAAARLAVVGSLRAQTLPEVMPLICGCVFLFLAFPLYAGREWARRALLATIYCALAALAISFSLMVFHQSRSPSASHPDLRVLIGLCALIAVLTPPGFVLAALHHADVRGAFRANDTSNKSLEPTADRRET